MLQKAQARAADYNRLQKYKTEEKLQNYWQQIQGTNSAEQALAIFNKANSTEDYQVANAVEAMVAQKYRGIFNVGRGNGGGGSRGGNRTNAGGSRADSSMARAISQGEKAADIMAVTLGRGGKVTSENLVAVRNYNRLNQEEWDTLHSQAVQGKLADMLADNGGDLQATYNQLAEEYGERDAARILATVNDGYFE
jgi:hypothetical protein